MRILTDDDLFLNLEQVNKVKITVNHETDKYYYVFSVEVYAGKYVFSITNFLKRKSCLSTSKNKVKKIHFEPMDDLFEIFKNRFQNLITKDMIEIKSNHKLCGHWKKSLFYNKVDKDGYYLKC